MKLDLPLAITLLPKVFDLGIKIYTIIKTGEPQDVTAELDALEKARLRPATEVIAQADADVPPQQAIDTQK